MQTIIMTPDEVQIVSTPWFEDTLRKVNTALTKGRRTFFAGTSAEERDIPPGYILRVISALEKAGWVVERKGQLPNGWFDVCTPKEKQC